MLNSQPVVRGQNIDKAAVLQVLGLFFTNNPYFSLPKKRLQRQTFTYAEIWPHQDFSTWDIENKTNQQFL